MKRKVFNKMLNKILMFIIIFSSFIFSLNITNVYAKTYENFDTIVEEKTYYNGAIEGIFSDDKIIIVLSKEETNKYKDYTISDFPEIDCQSVIDLTSNYNELLKNSNNNYNDQTLINYEKFNRILCLELNQKSKENVLLGIKELEKREEILSAEPSSFIEMMATPNDEKISDQWGLNNANIYSSWDISQNANQVMVGILDSGIDASHSDLTNNIYRASIHNLETTLHRDFTTGVELGTAILEPTDLYGHGTHVAGIIGACGDNNIGISGVCWSVKLVSLRVLNSEGEGSVDWLINAINYAGSNNIPILNCSLGAPVGSSALEDAIESYNGLLVCAAGNSGDNIDVNCTYPASYDFENILTVGAIDSDNDRSKWNGFLNLWGLLGDRASNYGETSVDIYAPGTNILSTYPNNDYEKMSGTSMAAPFVTGVAALILASNSYLTTSEIKNTIINGGSEITIKIPGAGCSGNQNQDVLKLDVNESIRLIAFRTNSTGEKIMGTWFEVEENLNIPNVINNIEITSIGEFAFKNRANLHSISIPNTVTNIDSNAFEDCHSLSSVTLPSNLTSIGSSAFKDCASLASITIPNNVTHIDSSAFEGCSYLQTINLSNNLTSIGTSAFKNCASLVSITIPNSVTNVDSSAFEGCSYLQNLALSNNLNAIGTASFKGCGSLTSLTIPSSVQYIDSNAFQNCIGLSNVIVERQISNITNLGENVFDGCHSTLQITVPTNRIAEYKNKEYWSSYKSKIVPNTSYTEYDLYNSSNINIPTTLNAGFNKIYKLDVINSNSYIITTTASSNITIKLYDYSMTLLDSSTNSNTSSITRSLSIGAYYYTVEYSSNSSSGTITTNITKNNVHTHNYGAPYIWRNYTQHRATCSCGHTQTQPHIVAEGSFSNLQQYATCLLCGGSATIGFVGPSGLSRGGSSIITVSGSYILPNGVIVLVEDDVARFMDGTLSFNDSVLYDSYPANNQIVMYNPRDEED